MALFVTPFTRRGYTVFAVVHGSQPKYAIPEILQDMHRAVRFIRYQARDYGIDPERIGITGGSAGGHLSLMQGTAGQQGDPKAKDPVDRVSSRVQAVACFFPPTDFLNYGKKGNEALGRGTLKGFKAPFDFTEFDTKTRSFVLITDEERRREIGKQISPVNHVTKGSAPSLIIHGDADKLVPIQQAEIMVARLKEVGVPARLIVKPGAVHGWKGMDKDLEKFVDWFDQYLLKKAPSPKDARKSSGARTPTRSASEGSSLRRHRTQARSASEGASLFIQARSASEGSSLLRIPRSRARHLSGVSGVRIPRSRFGLVWLRLPQSSCPAIQPAAAPAP